MSEMPGPGAESFRVCSLDGGGIRGLFTASFLATLEELGGVGLADCCDLLVGTSTGGVIALALALRIPARRVLDLYLEIGPQVFRGLPGPGIVGPKYPNERLMEAFRDLFGDAVLDDVATPVCITSYELMHAYPRIWKDHHAPGLETAGPQPIWKIALATSAAPAYLPAVQVLPEDCHVDGGLFANNPTLIGIVEAARFFHMPLEQVRVLSVGTGEHAKQIPYEEAARAGLFRWRLALLDHVFVAQARMTDRVAEFMLSPANYLRVNVPSTEAISLDDCVAAQRLVEPGAQEGRAHFPWVRDRFIGQVRNLGRECRDRARSAHP
jgi:hypothetical protein